MENFVGIDLHKYVSQLAVLRESKSPSQLRFANDVVTVERGFKETSRREQDCRRGNGFVVVVGGARAEEWP